MDPIDDNAIQDIQDDTTDEPAIDEAPADAESGDEASSDVEALAKLRERLIESEPLVAPELVSGATVGELEASFAIAKAAAERARDMTLASVAPRVSSGAPGRTNRAPTTAFEKIRAGLNARS